MDIKQCLGSRLLIFEQYISECISKKYSDIFETFGGILDTKFLVQRTRELGLEEYLDAAVDPDGLPVGEGGADQG